MSLSIIAAIGENNELGKDNDLIWRFKGDMKFFKATTLNHKVVMGRKTFESLPGLLPNRDHIVLTRSDLVIPDVEVYKNVKEFLEAYKDFDEEIFNIGGASIYSQLLDYADKLYLTEIEDSKEADVYFPSFDKEEFDKEVLGVNTENDIKYSHVLYKRR